MSPPSPATRRKHRAPRLAITLFLGVVMLGVTPMLDLDPCAEARSGSSVRAGSFRSSSTYHAPTYHAPTYHAPTYRPPTYRPPARPLPTSHPPPSGVVSTSSSPTSSTTSALPYDPTARQRQLKERREQERAYRHAQERKFKLAIWSSVLVFLSVSMVVILALWRKAHLANKA